MLADRVEKWAHLYKAEGFQQGMEKVFEKGEIRALQRVLHKRFGTIPAHIDVKIASANLTDIERWLDHAIDAKQLSDIFEQ